MCIVRALAEMVDGHVTDGPAALAALVADTAAEKVEVLVWGLLRYTASCYGCFVTVLGDAWAGSAIGSGLVCVLPQLPSPGASPRDLIQY